jgi:hypothetical protein
MNGPRMPAVKSQQTLIAEKKLREVMEEIFYATTSLTHALVKAHRNGMKAQSGEEAFAMIEGTVAKGLEAYRAAIAQPENKVAQRPEVNL